MFYIKQGLKVYELTLQLHWKNIGRNALYPYYNFDATVQFCRNQKICSTQFSKSHGKVRVEMFF